MPEWLLFVELLALLFAIVFCCAGFTNAIEWLGHRLNLSEGVVGSVFAAVGTALPETIVPIVAIVSGILGIGGLTAESGHDIGIGSILGAPFMLATLAFALSGLSVLVFTAMGKRKLAMTLNEPLFLRDMSYFFPAFGVAVAATQLPAGLMGLRYAIGAALLGWYAWYLIRTFQLEGVKQEAAHETNAADGLDAVEAEHDLEPLWLAPKRMEPATWLILTQTFLGVAGIVVLAQQFVGGIHTVAERYGIPAMVLSLIVVPIATELPEKFNSVLWISKSKDTLAMGNVTGAMVFQSCIPTAVGVCFTPWVMDSLTQTSAFLCLAAAAVVTLVVWKTPAKVTGFALMAAGLFYAAFLWQVFHQG
jgi:cation:H+ antiporter